MPATLEVDYVARRQVPALVGFGLAFLLLLAAWASGTVPAWLGAAGTTVLGGLVVYGLLLVARLRPGVRAAVLDESGITVTGAPTVPWSGLREVTVGPMRPAWLMGTRSLQIVSFLPRPGVSLPGPPGIDGRPMTKGRVARQHWYGTNLVLQTSLISVDGEQVLSAVRELGGVPVRRLPFPGARRWLAVIGGAALIGLVIGVVSGLGD